MAGGGHRLSEKRGFLYTKEYYQGVAHTIFPKAAVFTKAYCNLQESTEEIMAEWMEMAGDAYATRVPVKPGVRAYLEQCRQKGERMIVLTSAVPEHCRSALTHLHLMPYFETIFLPMTWDWTRRTRIFFFWQQRSAV